MIKYRELKPPVHLADAVECFWTIQHDGPADVAYRVLPDGCGDVIFSSNQSGYSLRVAGAMTRFEDYLIGRAKCMVGVRFRPGMWASALGVDAQDFTDGTPDLEDLWGKRGRELGERLSNADLARGKSFQDALGVLAGAFGPSGARTPAQRAVRSLQQNTFQPVSSLADQAGMSERQFRRVCLRETGLSPKLLARILRFRRASALLSARGESAAAVAAECGYADQPHMIAEFRRFGGQTPVQYRRYLDSRGT